MASLETHDVAGIICQALPALTVLAPCEVAIAVVDFISPSRNKSSAFAAQQQVEERKSQAAFWVRVLVLNDPPPRCPST